MSDLQSLTDQISKTLVESLTKDLQQRVIDQVITQVNARIASADLQVLIREVIRQNIAEIPMRLSDTTIPGRCVDGSSLKISGNSVCGGTIRQFSSSGISDKAASNCLEITDGKITLKSDTQAASSFMVSNDLYVSGTTFIEGPLIVTGPVAENTPFFQQVINITRESVLAAIDVSGLTVNKITVNGREVLTDRSLGTSVTDSNLQKVGLLKELQVRGESFLDQTLYVSKKRVGINTIEPSYALSVWDDEVEVSISKMRTDVGCIGTPRNQDLILSSNRKENLILHADGSISVKDINIDGTKITRGSLPNYASPAGHIVLNNAPAIGRPIGWVSLGSTKWAPFGTVQG